jgi:hypothetical protein
MNDATILPGAAAQQQGHDLALMRKSWITPRKDALQALIVKHYWNLHAD